MRRAALGIVPVLAVVLSTLAGAAPAQAFDCSTVPVGQANPSAQPEPMQPVWCLGPMAAEPTTRQQDRWGGWQDLFQTNIQDGHLNDGDMGYRVFNGLSAGGGGVQSRHFVNNNHWMVDMSRNNGGAAISPKQSFRFQNGKLVMEADVAAALPGYLDTGGDQVWPEMVWSTAPAPTGKVVDNLYLYGQFGGQWASGCRMNAGRDLVCALEASHTVPNNHDTAPCFSDPDTRVFEISWFQQCGTTHSGFAVSAGAPASAWRACQPNQMDMYCRDRFRFEWSQSGFVAYVNGFKFAEDSGWPGYAQIPADIASGQVPVYAYFGEWGDFSDSNAYRFHWGRVAVNPHDAGGNLLGPSAAPSYCPGQVQNTCPMGFMPSGSMPRPAPGGMPGTQMGAGTGHSHTSASHTQGGHGTHGGTAAGHANAASVYTDAALAGMLSGGERPEFWIMLGVMVAGVAAAAVVSWLWRGSTGPGRTG